MSDLNKQDIYNESIKREIIKNNMDFFLKSNFTTKKETKQNQKDLDKDKK